eukprot:UN06466
MTVEYPSGIRDVDCLVDDSGFGLVDTGAQGILGYHDWASRAKAEFEKIRTLNIMEQHRKMLKYVLGYQEKTKNVPIHI